MSWEHDRETIEAHYTAVAEERRVATLARLEVLRIREILQRYLPAAPAVIADVGGGPGTYALPLASAGYSVYLLDPLAAHVDRARARSAQQPPAARLESAVVGSATELPWNDKSVDACLFFGPMYHLTAQVDRLRALREARRVLRDGGVLLATAISRFVSVYAGLARGFLADRAFRAIAVRDVRDGQHRNPARNPDWFTTAFYHRPEEFADEITAGGLHLHGMLAVDGPAGYLRDLGWWLEDEDRRDTLLATVRSVESEPSLLGASPQLLAIAHKRGSSRAVARLRSPEP